MVFIYIDFTDFFIQINGPVMEFQVSRNVVNKTIKQRVMKANLRRCVVMRSSYVRVHLRERPTLNSCALSHWLPTATNDINSTLLACLYALFYAPFSGIYAATFPALIRLFSRLPPRSRRIMSYSVSCLLTADLCSCSLAIRRCDVF